LSYGVTFDAFALLLSLDLKTVNTFQKKKTLQCVKINTVTYFRNLADLQPIIIEIN